MEQSLLCLGKNERARLEPGRRVLTEALSRKRYYWRSVETLLLIFLIKDEREKAI